jgi:two-component system chemotaxis response regulator CheB
VTLSSLVETFGRRAVVAILTGMGQDGADGAAAVRAAGGHVIAEDESSCVVFGMPRAVIERGGADRVVPLDQVAAAIATALESRATRAVTR